MSGFTYCLRFTTRCTLTSNFMITTPVFLQIWMENCETFEKQCWCCVAIKLKVRWTTRDELSFHENGIFTGSQSSTNNYIASAYGRYCIASSCLSLSNWIFNEIDDTKDNFKYVDRENVRKKWRESNRKLDVYGDSTHIQSMCKIYLAILDCLIICSCLLWRVYMPYFPIKDPLKCFTM
jgi:hypothetical protein